MSERKSEREREKERARERERESERERERHTDFCEKWQQKSGFRTSLCVMPRADSKGRKSPYAVKSDLKSDLKNPAPSSLSLFFPPCCRMKVWCYGLLSENWLRDENFESLCFRQWKRRWEQREEGRCGSRLMSVGGTGDGMTL